MADFDLYAGPDGPARLERVNNSVPITIADTALVGLNQKQTSELVAKTWHDSRVALGERGLRDGQYYTLKRGQLNGVRVERPTSPTFTGGVG